MPELLVRGLDDEGPGDVVGAFVNEAGADPDAIRDVDVDGDTATVEYDGDADRVAADMDGESVGRSTVAVSVVGDAVGEYVAEQRRLVELEREAEMERHENEIRRLSGHERESKGRALVAMRGSDEGEGLGGHLVKFSKAERGRELPDHELGVGDLVMVSKQDPLRDDNPTGTVAAVTNYSVTVAFDRKPPGFVFGDGLRLDLYVNDVTFQRMLDALEAGLDPSDVAVVSPYDDQVDRLRDAVPEGVEVDTVDGFQGREKEAVFVSLVRSNDRDDVGFLDEQRRFNVAATRARRKLVVVGDSETVTEVPALDSFAAYAREHGRVVEPAPAAAHAASE